MLVEPNLDVMLHDQERGLKNKFALVTLTLKRARQLNDGSPALVEVPAKKPVTIALHEIYDSKVRLRDKDATTAIPMSQEDAQAAALAAALGTPQGFMDE